MRAARFAVSPRLESRLHAAFAVILAFGAAAAFYAPALRATGGDWPAPLDDVLIHFDYARAIARGAPFAWIAGQGFSSGETSVLYPFVLAAGYALGFRGLALGAWAALVACASLIVMMRSLRALAAPAPWWVAWLGGALLVSVGVLDWSWFSGMEVALFGAALTRALVAVRRAREAPPTARARRQWAAGAWGAALVLLRPEAVVVVAPFAVIVARRAGARSALAALTRAALPGALATLAVLGANAIFTGDPQSAGARLKLLSSNPYLHDVDRARELVTNLAHVKIKVLETMVTARHEAWGALPLLAVAALFARRTRALAAACLVAAGAWTLLVSWNGAARYQNYRYYMPALAILLVAATLGIAAVAARARLVAFVWTLGVAALAWPRVPAQVAFFRAASQNVHDQQIEAGRRVAARTSPGTMLMVGDAGAIPYMADRPAIDALGLGGYRGLPFARAATLGEAATIELVERLRPDERPRLLVLYPNWFPETTARFGRELDRVAITENVICGGLVKGIYAADWGALDAADAEDDGDSIDVADVVSEEAHGYRSPAPDGGWTMLDVRRDESGALRFDAGRITPEGTCESFVATRAVPGPAAFGIRTDAPVDAELAHARAGRIVDRVSLRAGAVRAEAWAHVRAPLAEAVAPGDTLTLCAKRGALRDYHAWTTREPTSARDALTR